jgi:hypothetical protein
MRRIVLATIVLVAAVTGARAQVGTGPAPTRPPAIGGIGTPSPGIGTGFSPYLNLNRGGNSAAQNLYGIVRPQMSMQQSIQSLQQQQATLAGGGTPGQDDALTAQGIVVGTRVRFLNTGGYFQNLAGGTSATATGFNFTRPQTGMTGMTTGLGTGTAPRGRAR